MDISDIATNVVPLYPVYKRPHAPDDFLPDLCVLLCNKTPCYLKAFNCYRGGRKKNRHISFCHSVIILGIAIIVFIIPDTTE